MKYPIFAILLMVPMVSLAQYRSSPEITCGAAEVFDAGYSLSLMKTESGHDGSLSRGSYGGPQKLGTEPMKVERDTNARGCTLKITQTNDVDGNELLLVITAAQAGGGNYGTLNMKLDGQPIDPSFRKMNCFISQGAFNRYCNPSDGGASHQEGSD
ncbi:MAG TPA: hypothetical protein VFV50_10790 [Bdellovibrionales bacterium]|nr:hypothetical protein [Bdellovibrionales bacterium]